MNRTDRMVLKFRDVLRETERLGADDLQAYQNNLLTPLLLHARKNVPFYAERLNSVFDGDDITLARWKEIPVVSREEALRERKALRSSAVPPHLGGVSEEETSGSMGRPMRFYQNELLMVATLAMTDRLYRWWRFDGSKTMVSLVSPRMNIADPQGTATHGWRSGFLEGAHIMRQSTPDIDAHIDWLRDVRPDYLVSYASMLRPLAERTSERGMKLRFERIISRGGVVDDEAWGLCEEVFGASLVDQYGANEIGQIACQCPVCDSYHICSEAVFAEVLDENGNPAGPGETGRVVLTPFYNYAMPFIRYEIGDLAEVAPDNGQCRIKLPRLSRITGRYRNNFKLRDGRIIFPNPPMSGFRKYFSYAQLQVVQTGYETIEVRYVPLGDDENADEAGLEKWLQQELGLEFSVKLRAVESIAALPSGKFEDFVSLVCG